MAKKNGSDNPIRTLMWVLLADCGLRLALEISANAQPTNQTDVSEFEERRGPDERAKFLSKELKVCDLSCPPKYKTAGCKPTRNIFRMMRNQGRCFCQKLVYVSSSVQPTEVSLRRAWSDWLRHQETTTGIQVQEDDCKEDRNGNRCADRCPPEQFWIWEGSCVDIGRGKYKCYCYNRNHPDIRRSWLPVATAGAVQAEAAAKDPCQAEGDSNDRDAECDKLCPDGIMGCCYGADPDSESLSLDGRVENRCFCHFPDNRYKMRFMRR